MSISGVRADTLTVRAQYGDSLVEIVADAMSRQSLLGFVAGLPEKNVQGLVCGNMTPEMLHLRKLLEICITSDRIKVAARFASFFMHGEMTRLYELIGDNG